MFSELCEEISYLFYKKYSDKAFILNQIASQTIHLLSLWHIYLTGRVGQNWSEMQSWLPRSGCGLVHSSRLQPLSHV